MSAAATIKRQLALDGVRAAYLLQETATGETPGLHSGNKLVWTGAPSVSASGGIGGLGYVTNIGTVEAAEAFSAAPIGAAPRTFIVAFRTLDSDGVVVSTGTEGTNTDDALAIDSASAVSWLHTGNSATVSAALADGEWHIAALRSSAGGDYRLDVDGARLADGTFPAGALATAPGPLRVFRHPSISTPRRMIGDVAFVAVWDRELSDADVARYAALLMTPHRLGGIAALDDASPASAVLVRRVGDREHLLTITPAAPSGVWEAIVPAGDYEIACIGPDGFQPQVFSPVSAVAV